MFHFRLFLALFICSSFFILAFPRVTFTSVVCNNWDKSYVVYEYCNLEVINQKLKYLSIRLNALKIPITNVFMSLAVTSNIQRWKPTLYNYTIDCCSFINSKRRNAFVNLAFKMINSYSNFNHTCPYNHDFILHNFPSTYVESFWLKKMPMPTGEYEVQIIFKSNGLPRSELLLNLKLDN